MNDDVKLFFVLIGKFSVECMKTFAMWFIGLFILSSICFCINTHPILFGGVVLASIFFWRWYI